MDINKSKAIDIIQFFNLINYGNNIYYLCYNKFYRLYVRLRFILIEKWREDVLLDLKSLLNKEQYEGAVTTEGPVLILAGAGSGKTRVLTHRMAHMIEDLNIFPYKILAITFSKSKFYTPIVNKR